MILRSSSNARGSVLPERSTAPPFFQNPAHSPALAAAVAAVIHCAIDVPGHRVGAALLALMVLALARSETTETPRSAWMPLLTRLSGVFALGVAAIVWRFPDESNRAQMLLHAARFSEAEAAADRALQRAPLDWKMYFVRAGARACEGRNLEAVADFRRARTLEPHYAGLPLSEGRFWLQTQPLLALNVWREALRRAPASEEEEIFGSMLSASPDSEAFRSQLLAIAYDRPVLQLEWFRQVPPEEARREYQAIAAAAAHLTSAQRVFFQKRAEEIGAVPGAR